MPAIVERTKVTDAFDVQTILSGGLAKIVYGEHLTTLYFSGIDGDEGLAVLHLVMPTAVVSKMMEDARNGRCSANGVAN